MKINDYNVDTKIELYLRQLPTVLGLLIAISGTSNGHSPFAAEDNFDQWRNFEQHFNGIFIRTCERGFRGPQYQIKNRGSQQLSANSSC